MDVHLFAYAASGDSAGKALNVLKLKLAGLIGELQEAGWTFDSTTIDNEPVNLQTPEGVQEAQTEADELAAQEESAEEPPPAEPAAPV